MNHKIIEIAFSIAPDWDLQDKRGVSSTEEQLQRQETGVKMKNILKERGTCVSKM